MNRCLLLLPALLLVAADPAVERASRKERARLLGTWVLVPDLPVGEVLRSGIAVHEVTAEKINVSITMADQARAKPMGTLIFVLDPTKDPKAIDVTPDFGADKGKTLQGIYQLDGEQWTIAMPTTAAGPRPTRLAKNKETQLLTFRRSSPDAVQKLIASGADGIQKFLADAKAVQLATSRLAKPIDGKSGDALILTVARNGGFEAAGHPAALATLADLHAFLKERRQAKPETTAVILRADKGASAASLLEAAQAARVHGFTRFFLDVLRKPTGEGRLEVSVPDWRQPVEDVTVFAQRPVGEGGDLGPLAVKAGANPMPVENLDAIEKQLREQRGQDAVLNKDSVRLSPEGALTVGPLVAVIDSCLASGFPRVTLGPLLDRDESKRAKIMAPSAADQAKAEKDIKAIYEAHYTKPATLPQRLRDAAAICDDSAAKFVFLREAADAAGRAGQLQESMDSIDLLANDFSIDPWPLKLEKFKKAPANQAVVDAALREASNASLANRRDYAARFVRIAELNAKQARDADLGQYVEERRELLKLPKLDRVDPFAPPGKRPSAQDAEPSAALVERTTVAPVSVLSLVLWYGVPIAFMSVAVLAGVIWWMRREKAVRSRLSQARGRQFDLPDDDPPMASPP